MIKIPSGVAVTNLPGLDVLHPSLTDNQPTARENRMRRLVLVLAAVGCLTLNTAPAAAQTLATDDAVLQDIWTEAMDNSQLEVLAHELLDVIGPRLVGSPGQMKAHDWAVATFKRCGIEAQNEQ